MNSLIIIKYIEYKTIICNFFRTCKSYITTITSVKGFDTQTHNIIIRYFIMYLLYNIKRLIKNMMSSIDKEYKLIEIKRSDDDNTCHILENIKIHQLVKNPMIKSDLQKHRIYLKFELDSLCLKKYLKEYRENRDSHSLQNILLLNNINVDQDSNINIQYYDKGLKKNIVHKYDDIKDKKIHDLC